MSVASERPGLPGWRFGRTDDGFETVRTPLAETPRTDANGKASLKVTLPQLPPTERPLEAEVIVRLAEGGGRAIERSIKLPVAPTGVGIGVRPLFKGEDLAQGSQAGFDVMAVDAAGKQIAKPGREVGAVPHREQLPMVPHRRHVEL